MMTDAPTANSALLISVAQLREHLDDPRWCIFDVRHDLFDTGAGQRAYRRRTHSWRRICAHRH